MSGNATMPEENPDLDQYGYYVSRTACIIFLVLFGTSTAIHFVQAIKFRTWFMLWTAVMCGIGELIGWGARLWSSIKPQAEDPFTIQITTTIIAPTFLVAANFIVLGRVISIVGPEFSRISPLWYTRIFVSADVLALIIQAVGGAMASIADDRAGSDRGAQVMLAGIGLQFAALCIYTLLAAEFIVRFAMKRPVRNTGERTRPDSADDKVKLMILGLILSAVLLYIRTVYRTIELTDGWNGSIIHNQALFNFMDGLPITLAMFTFNAFAPGYLVYNSEREIDEKLEMKSQTRSSSSAFLEPSNTA